MHIQELVIEKESRIRESMLMMGLRLWVLWTSWFIKQLLFMSIWVVVYTILFKVEHIAQSYILKSALNGQYIVNVVFHWEKAWAIKPPPTCAYRCTCTCLFLWLYTQDKCSFWNTCTKMFQANMYTCMYVSIYMHAWITCTLHVFTNTLYIQLAQKCPRTCTLHVHVMCMYIHVYTLRITSTSTYAGCVVLILSTVLQYGRIWPRSDGFLILIFFLLFVISIIAFGFLVR